MRVKISWWWNVIIVKWENRLFVSYRHIWRFVRWAKWGICCTGNTGCLRRDWAVRRMFMDRFNHQLRGNHKAWEARRILFISLVPYAGGIYVLPENLPSYQVQRVFWQSLDLEPKFSVYIGSVFLDFVIDVTVFGLCLSEVWQLLSMVSVYDAPNDSNNCWWTATIINRNFHKQ